MPDDFDFFNEEAKPKPRTPPQPRRAEPVGEVRPPLAEPEIEEITFEDEVNEREPPRRAEKTPSRSNRHREDHRDDPPLAKKGLSPLILAAIAGGALLVIGGGVAVIWAAREKDPDRKEKAKTVNATNNPPPVVVPKKELDPNSPTAETVARVKKATVMVRVLFNNGKGGEGSGFVEKSSGLIVTNAHVVGLKNKADGGPRLINLVVNSGQGDKEYTLAGEVEDDEVDVEHDLALIHPKIIEVGERHVVPEGLVVAKNPSLVELQNLFIFGFPLGTELGREISVRPTKVTSIRKNAVQVEGGMTFGNSGGPVVDVKGNVVGVAVAGIKNEAINFAVPSEKVLELLARRKK